MNSRGAQEEVETQNESVLQTRNMVRSTLLTGHARVMLIKEVRIVRHLVCFGGKILSQGEKIGAVEFLEFRFAASVLWLFRELLRVIEGFLGPIFVQKVADEVPHGVTIDEYHLLHHWVSMAELHFTDHRLLHFLTRLETGRPHS